MSTRDATAQAPSVLGEEEFARLRSVRHRSPQDIAAVLGTAMEYEIAEVVDSEYDVVAKVSKQALARLGK